MLSVQLGAALSQPLFGSLGPAGAAWLRLVWAAALLLVVARPRLRGRSRADLGSALLLGVASAGMTVLFFEAVARIPLGAASTIEFLGPLAVAVFASRRRLDLLWSLCALGGVALMSGAAFAGARGWAPAGLAFASGAAACWAAYILLTKRVGARWSGVEGLAVSMAVAAVAVTPLGLVQASSALSLRTLAITAGLALLLPVLPYVLEMRALRRMHVRAFSILMSVEPAIGALIGLIVLSQTLWLAQYAGIGLVILANIAVSWRKRGPTKEAAPKPALEPIDDERCRTASVAVVP